MGVEADREFDLVSAVERKDEENKRKAVAKDSERWYLVKKQIHLDHYKIQEDGE